MAWLWQGMDEPHTVPMWAYTYVKEKFDYLIVNWLCVEEINFQGDTLVTLIRVFDPLTVPEGINVSNFGSLDECPQIIQFEGYHEVNTDRVRIARGAARRKKREHTS
jgi:hypothetical protein